MPAGRHVSRSGRGVTAILQVIFPISCYPNDITEDKVFDRLRPIVPHSEVKHALSCIR